MFKHADRRMDFRATPALWARRESIPPVDRDFETYRIEGRKSFGDLPGRRG